MQKINFFNYRCKCEFYYVAYGESSIDGVTDRIPKRPEVNPWSTDERDHFVNSFRFLSQNPLICQFLATFSF